ncbi:acetyltransferase, partial [Pseudoneurospora amorphoporcata]
IQISPQRIHTHKTHTISRMPNTSTYHTSSSSVHLPASASVRLPPQSHPGSTTTSNAINTARQRSNNMDGSHHMSSSITELDLSKCHPRMVDRIKAVPGLKTSAAFFTFLRANLVLPHSGLSSNPSTPYLEPTYVPPPLPPKLSRSPSSSSSSYTKSKSKVKPNAMAATPPTTTASGAVENLDDIPPLTLDILTTRPAKTDALKLIADSIAQQRQQASYHLITHPACVAVLFAALGVTYQFGVARKADSDLGTTLMLLSGVVMTYLIIIRYFTAGYLNLAESLSWDWLLNPDGTPDMEEDIILGTHYGNELIGALVLRLEPASSPRSSSPSSSNKARKSHARHNSFSAKSLKGGKGIIRAWTTKLRYRGRGVGKDMLVEAVRLTREKCGKEAEVGFAAEHANANCGKVLPEWFCGGFRRGERRAAGCLEGVLGEFSSKR